MSKAQLVITAVVVQGRSKSEVARDYDVSRTWVQQLVKRYESEGAAAFEPHSRRPHHSPQAIDATVEDKIMRLRKTLDKQGYDAGAATIAEHLTRDPAVTKAPAVSTIWRILTRRGFVAPQPQKRPRSSWKRFCAEQPNQLWQADVTHWRLADDTAVEILDMLDDHSRVVLASTARPVTTGADVVDTVTAAITQWGTPAGALTDNGAIFTAKQRGAGRTALEIMLGELGIKYSRSRPYHPQTCGKVERFHQTLKKHLRALPPAATIDELQYQIDDFLDYYNTVRSHRALGRRTPLEAFNDRPKAFPSGYQIPPHYRVRHDRIDAGGVITIRYNSRLHHIGLSKHLRGTKVTVLINDRDIRVLHRDTGQLIRKLTLDPTRDYQPRGVKCGNSPENRLQM
ncbi:MULTISPECIES: IS481 family transposase [unclassified Mycobacterium]|uniref:IS481 family transposase n=1 Tax=unclassified Mycobacterium TaxID=2642494 RepID=UPI00074016E6|nr:MULTISPECIES: IS481 family transposase [unclassified Mycobacterium]KUH86103.1 transposase [Mycobacterium sp. IS-1556]KUH86973.1 transposase [Mycobacterium sp. GA-0227b]KUH92250.1 transposase [Mycobacterium sp. GA-1999]